MKPTISKEEIDRAYEGSKGTALSRKKLSLPMTYLRANEAEYWNSARRLDYGCGKGYDADFLRMDKYDPHHHPVIPEGHYDLVTCNYVLNVLPPEMEGNVLRAIAHCLNSTGTAFITVRRDVKKEGFRSRGSYQREVELSLPSYRLRKGSYEIYKATKQQLEEYTNEVK